jgi:pantothenate kinase
MQSSYEHLAQQILDLYKSKNSPNTFIVAIAGPPGSGKSATAKRLVSLLNAAVASADTQPLAKCIGMDGYHYTRQYLREMKDSARAFERRGAPFTFDSLAFAEMLMKLRHRDVSKGE